MSDIDFDELDKAVNSLMSGVDTSKRNTALDEPEDKVVALEGLDESSPDTPTPVVPPAQTDAVGSQSQSDEHEEQVPQPAVPAPSLAVKRRGQFMDMIHPSSDMKQTSRAVRREGVVIAAPAEARPYAADPTAEATVVDSSKETIADTPTGSMVEPLSSPFLSDAKPEKRPLGGIPTPTEPVAETEAVEDQVPATPDTQVLPEELTGDILAVEANDLMSSPSTPAVSDDEPAPIAEEAASVVEAIAEPVAVPADTTGTGSIPQQYAESPSTGDQTSGSIYDTSNYHQPIETAAPAKKSSPLKWILFAIGLLVLGGGAGVAYFFLMH
jgi:hypothetical protein